jgi:hypothetical protein
MLHPSIDSTNPPAVAIEPLELVARQQSASTREPATAPSPAREEETRSSPVCAAGWAY